MRWWQGLAVALSMGMWFFFDVTNQYDAAISWGVWTIVLILLFRPYPADKED